MTTPIFRLPPEIVDHIFSFLHLSTASPSPGKRDRFGWLSYAHVCHRWREIALNQPRFWNFIDFNTLTLAGATEILVRSKEAPLYLVVDFCPSDSDDDDHWNPERVDAVYNQLVAHASRIHTLNISSFDLSPLSLSRTLARLTSPAPVLESLSLCAMNKWFIKKQRIPPTLFDSTAPRLIHLELDNCYISWSAPLLKGLRHLKLLYHDDTERPDLQSWRDAMCELSRLESLVLHAATPIAPQVITSIPEPMQVVTLPCLTRLYLSDSANCCALVLAHLVLPTLTSLRVDVMSTSAWGKDLRILLPHFARNAHGPQDTMPLQSMVISACPTRTDILLWTIPDADMEYHDNGSFTQASLSSRAAFTAFYPLWDLESSTAVCHTVLSALPMGSLSTLTVLDYMEPPKAFWRTNEPRWPLLKRVRLGCGSLLFFTSAAMEELPNEDTFLPSLTTLIITGGPLNELNAVMLLYISTKQRIPIQTLDLSECGVEERTMRFLSDMVTDIREPVQTCRLQKLVWPATLIGWHPEYFADWSDEEDEDETDSDWENVYGEGDHGEGGFVVRELDMDW